MNIMTSAKQEKKSYIDNDEARAWGIENNINIKKGTHVLTKWGCFHGKEDLEWARSSRRLRAVFFVAKDACRQASHIQSVGWRLST